MVRGAKEGSCRSAIALTAGRVLAGHLVAAGAVRRLSNVMMVPEAAAGQWTRCRYRGDLAGTQVRPGLTCLSGRGGGQSESQLPCAPAPSAITSSYAMPIVIGPMPFGLSR